MQLLSKKPLRPLLIPSVVFAVLAMSGCGGGGSSTSVAVTPAETILEGPVIKGPVIGAEVIAYRVIDGSKGPEISRSVTDANGNYKMSLKDYSGVVLIEATAKSGSTMKDEASGTAVSVQDFQMRSLTKVDPVANPGSSSPLPQTATVSPFSELAYELAAQLGNQKFTSDSVSKSLGLIRDQFGFDPVSTPAVDATGANADNAALDSRKYALALAGVSQMSLLQSAQQDPNTKACLTAAADQAKRIKCAVDAVRTSMVVGINGSIQASIALADLVLATKTFEQSEKNKIKSVSVSNSVAFAKLEEMGQAAKSGKAISINLNDENAPGIIAAKNLISNLRSNGEAIEIGLNEKGIVSSIDQFGKSAENAVTMAEDIVDLLGLIEEGLSHWREFKANKRVDPSWRDFSGTSPPPYGYRACSLYSTSFPTGSGNDDPWKFPVGLPHIGVSFGTDTQTKALYSTNPSVVDTTSLLGQAPTTTASVNWMGCSIYSDLLPSEVDAPNSSKKEFNTSTRFRRTIRFDFGSETNSSNPSRILYQARTTKNYIQRYSESDPRSFTKTVNLSNVTSGSIDLTWNADGSLASVKIEGDMPPSAKQDGSYRYVQLPEQQSTRWVYLVSGAVLSERYATQLSATVSETSDLAKLELSKLRLGFVPLGATAASAFFDLAPDGKPSYLSLPTESALNCSTIQKAEGSLGVTVSNDSKGRFDGRLYLDSVGCGTQNDPANPQKGKVTLNGKIAVPDKTGAVVELLNATLALEATDGQPLISIDGTLALVDRPPLKLAVRFKETPASSSSNAKEEVSLKYDQGGFVLSFDGSSLVDSRGNEVSSSISMSGTGGISMNMNKGDKKIDVKHNGKVIGTLDMESKKLQFSDGSFEYLR